MNTPDTRYSKEHTPYIQRNEYRNKRETPEFQSLNHTQPTHTNTHTHEHDGMHSPSPDIANPEPVCFKAWNRILAFASSVYPSR